jgi:hypothetical protein
MGDREGTDALDDLGAAARYDARLGALAEYAELRRRWLRGEAQPGDLKRRRAARAVLDRTGGIPHELRWPKRR